MESNVDGPRALTAAERTGRRLLAFAFMAALGCNIAAMIWRSAAFGFDPVSIVRLPLTIGLGAAVWQGYVWAHRAAVLIFGVGLAYLFWTTLQQPHPIAILIGVPFSLLFLLLTLSPRVRSFLQYQRNRGPRNIDAK